MDDEDTLLLCVFIGVAFEIDGRDCSLRRSIFSNHSSCLRILWSNSSLSIRILFIFNSFLFIRLVFSITICRNCGDSISANWLLFSISFDVLIVSL